jgi:hypothetical protein
LKDRAYPAYLYSGVIDSTRVTNRRIPAEDLVSRLDMILRGKVSNVGAPIAYSAWNLPPPKSFFSFVSNPLAGDSGLGLRVRPSPEDIEVLVASLCDLPNDERQVHFEMPTSPDDAEINVVLDMLAGESSDSAPAETMVVVVIPETVNTVDTRKPEGTRPKRLRQVSRPTAPTEEKKKKRNIFSDCHAWIRMLDLLLLFAKKYQQRSLLKLTPLVVYLLKLNPMGVTVHQLKPMGVTLMKLSQMGVILLKLTPKGVILHHLLSAFLTRTNKRKKKFR